MKKSQNIIIVGGAGFIGEYLVKRLLKRRGANLSICHKEKLPVDEQLAGIKYYRLAETDIRRQFEKILPGIDCLVWLAQPDEKTTKELVSVVPQIKSLKKIVYASTLLLYADSNSPRDERALVRPLTAYEKAKYGEEILLSSLIKISSVQLYIARLANVYGDMKNRGVVNYIFSAALGQKEIITNGDGKQIRDYIFVEDIANLLYFLIFYDQKEQKEIFNICTSRGSNIMEVIKITEKIINKKIKLKFNPPILEKQSIIGDNNKILKPSGYKIKFNIKKGLEKTYNNYLKKYVK